MRPERPKWPNRERRIDVAWALFALANLAAMLAFPTWETVPFHFIWVSLTLLFGFRVWKLQPTLAVLAAVMMGTGLFIWLDVRWGDQPLDELTEVPLMAAMFLAMVWHARRRLNAMEETERISMANLRLLERERWFVQDASHELRTPITVALGHAELIQRRAVDPTVEEDAAIIADELMRLRRLADRLLLLAGTEDPEFLHLQPVDVESIVVDAMRRWTATPRRWQLENGDEAIVLADADRLAVVLDALIENAVKHTRERDTIEVSMRRRDGTVTIGVRDTGVGIPAADLDRIFDRFARADPGRSRHTGGFGLGLSIVKAIVDAHGGTVDVETEEGVGTRFEIRLPVVETAVRQRREREAPAGTDAASAVGAGDEDARRLAR
ncbi:MAG: HAMP domain-containing histidine kinase [Actinomycetota bacterium]|nr:HAMP domain-containing histidine kinase [Actinomycetota bacterium]